MGIWLICLPITLGKVVVNSSRLCYCMTKPMFIVEVLRKICIVETFQEASKVDNALTNAHQSLCLIPIAPCTTCWKASRATHIRPENCLSYIGRL